MSEFALQGIGGREGGGGVREGGGGVREGGGGGRELIVTGLPSGS